MPDYCSDFARHLSVLMCMYFGGVLSTIEAQAQGEISTKDSVATETRIWINTSYQTILKKVGDREWHEVDAKSGKVIWHLDELDATDSYVELFLRERKQKIRLHDSRIELIEPTGTKDVAFGRWQFVAKRDAWDSETYNGIIVRIDERSWVEFDKQTGDRKVEMAFVSETEKYIELYNPKHRERVRLYATHIETEKDGKWTKIGTGRWTNQGETEGGNVSSQSKRPKGRDAEVSEAGKVTVESTKIERTTNALGKPSLKLHVKLRNNGDKPVRIVDGTYQVKDASGRIVKEIPYTILADSDDSPGLAPGQAKMAGGFMLPRDDSIRSFDVVITKVLESASEESTKPDLNEQAQTDPLNGNGKIKDSLRYLGQKKYPSMDGDVVHLYLATGEIDIDALEERCRILKSKTDAPVFSCIFVFDSKKHARFPPHSGRSGYGMDFDAYDHIKASYTFNKVNGYSKLDLSGMNRPERSP